VKINAKNCLRNAENSIIRGVPNTPHQHTKYTTAVEKAKDDLAFAFMVFFSPN
jgi:hypothetical protein